jgi:hypothetical protein
MQTIGLTPPKFDVHMETILKVGMDDQRPQFDGRQGQKIFCPPQHNHRPWDEVRVPLKRYQGNSISKLQNQVANYVF